LYDDIARILEVMEDSSRTDQTPLERVLDLLDGVRRQQRGWSARCPAHEDEHNSLSVGEGDDGRVLLHCFAGCSIEAIVARLGLELRDLSLDAGGAAGDSSRERATAQRGLTLEEYAATKQLPKDLLAEVGVKEVKLGDRPVLRIAYFDEDGTEVAVRFRVALEGEDRFRWKKASKPRLYGLNRLARARERGYVVLVEGESDVHTLWHHGYPAVGLPGAGTWVEERDAPALAALDTIYVVVEPDRGGDAVLAWLRRSSIRDRVRLVRLAGAADVSELHLRSAAQASERIDTALREARPWSQHERLEREIARRASWKQCAGLAQTENILDQLVTELEQSGLVGEARTAQLLYLALTSRLLEKPVSVAVKGPSAGGKSYTLERVLELFPRTAYYELTAMSERALAYGTEPLAHRVLIIYEAAGLEGDFASYLVRSLLSEGRLRYETVEKTTNGLQARVVQREGPTGLIVTTTAISLHPENETRMLSIPVTDTPEQTKRILLALAEGTTPIDAEKWLALQTWIQTGDRRVVVPYARELAELIPPVAVRLRRDFRLLLSLIQAHALLSQARRRRDENGAIVATLEDYARVRELVHDLFAEGVEAGVPPTIRETVEAVARLTPNAAEGVSISRLAGELALDKASVSRRVAGARKRGYLKNLEERRGRPARLVVDQPLPEELELLPSREALEQALHGCSVASDQGGTPATSRSADGASTDEEYAESEHERLRNKFPDLFERSKP